MFPTINLNFHPLASHFSHSLLLVLCPVPLTRLQSPTHDDFSHAIDSLSSQQQSTKLPAIHLQCSIWLSIINLKWVLRRTHTYPISAIARMPKGDEELKGKENKRKRERYQNKFPQPKINITSWREKHTWELYAAKRERWGKRERKKVVYVISL